MHSLYSAMFGVHRNGCTPFIVLCLGSIGKDHVTRKLCYKWKILQKELQETSLQRNYKKMATIGLDKQNF